MKRLTIFLLAILLFSSCKKFLNQPPLDRITEDAVWQDRALMDTYIYKIYDNMPWSPLSDFSGVGDGAYRHTLSDEARSSYDWTSVTNTFRPGNWGTSTNWWPMDWWGYWNVYKANYSLQKIEAAGSAVLTAEEKNNRLGELFFIRAYTYFELVKRYGGVPIILSPQDPETTPAEEYFPERNTEKEVYDQIIADVQKAYTLLPASWTLKGRATKWAAKALESRAALYAASIAKYGTVELNGVVGIPAASAAAYYTISLNASKLIINTGPFTLFRKYPDASQNYYQLFVDETMEETIFKKIYIPYEKGHEWDIKNVPFSYRVDWGSSLSPTKQMVDSYEVLSTGLLPSEPDSGFDPANPYVDRDPRLAGTIITNNALFQGLQVESWYATERNGVIDTKSGTGVGKDGMGLNQDVTKTGYYIRKYLYDSGSPLFTQKYYSGQDDIISRLGEIYLNAAEAAVETGNDAEARSFIEPVRTRAGLLKNLNLATYSGTALRDRIRNERKLELAFEDHRYWDLRRWRVATTALSIQVQGDRPLRHIDANGKVTFTYETINAETLKMNFFARQYYLPIGRDRRSNNSKLVENPGY
ncbi:RagB/SusD family nutrient uptake outer membrane protein [Pedobacter sp. AW31-3R]|uniref:RagB/SusD family nutrient uptake outer membrane protein n=1 Tax=Pedobacter sp. AW31-3R TaxID=3445781 RepID=UPI003F9F6F1F